MTAAGTRRLRGALLVLFFVLFVLATMAACSSLLGIEDFPTFKDAGGADATRDEGGPPVDCKATPCADRCHDFCDDFESEPPLARWPVPTSLGLSTPSIAYGTSSVAVGAPGDRSSHALEVHAENDAGVGSAYVLGQLDLSAKPGVFDGILMRFDLELETFDLTAADVQTDAGVTVMLAGLGSPSGDQIGGGALYFTNTFFYLATAESLLAGETPVDYRPISEELKVSAQKGIWVNWTLFIGTPQRAAAIGVRGCPTSALVMAAQQASAIGACLPVVDDGDGGAARWMRPFVVLGSRIRNGAVTYRVDNVLVDYLAK